MIYLAKFLLTNIFTEFRRYNKKSPKYLKDSNKIIDDLEKEVISLSLLKNRKLRCFDIKRQFMVW